MSQQTSHYNHAKAGPALWVSVRTLHYHLYLIAFLKSNNMQIEGRPTDSYLPYHRDLDPDEEGMHKYSAENM